MELIYECKFLPAGLENIDFDLANGASINQVLKKSAKKLFQKIKLKIKIKIKN